MMPETRSWRTILGAVVGLMMAGLLSAVSLATGDPRGHGNNREEDTLLVWASDKAHVAPDFLAVLDFDRDSRTYGKVLRTVPLTGASAVGNEPHHVGLSRDGRTLALGGLLSVLRGQDQVFFFDVTQAATADVHPLGQSAAGLDHRRVRPAQERRLSRDLHGRRGRRATRTGGRVQRQDEGGADLAPDILPTRGSIRTASRSTKTHNLMVTSDFICPLRTLHVHGGATADIRGSVRVWDFAQRDDRPRPSPSATRRTRPARWRCS